jgi:hypothetical protein
VRRFAFVWLVVLTVVARASAAWGAPSERVALGGSGPDAQLTRQLRVELAGLGFEVVMIDDLGKVDLNAEVLRLTRDEDLLAVIRASADGSRLEVWAADPESGIYVTRGIDLVRSGGSSRIVALRAVELLRAGLREIEARRQLARLPPPALPLPAERAPTPNGPPPGPALSPIDLPRRPTPPAPRYVLSASAGLIGGAGSVADSVTASAAFEVWPLSDWGITARAFVPLDSPTVSNDKGSTSVGVYLGAVALAFRLRPGQAKWQLQAEAGGGGAMLRMEGTARAGLVGTSDVATSPTAYGALGLAYDLTPDVAITAGGMCGVLFPRITIAFAKVPVAHWGAFYGAGTLGAALRFR